MYGVGAKNRSHPAVLACARPGRHRAVRFVPFAKFSVGVLTSPGQEAWFQHHHRVS